MSSSQIRADVVESPNEYIRAGRITINAPAQRIFDVLADPRQHSLFDGSGTVKNQISGPDRLELGSTFGMAMRIKLPYRITNTVVEFDEPRLIAWRHLGHHRWRYELNPIDDNTTEVTETFDGSTARFPPMFKAMKALDRNQIAILKSLVALKKYCE